MTKQCLIARARQEMQAERIMNRYYDLLVDIDAWGYDDIWVIAMRKSLSHMMTDYFRFFCDRS